MHKSLPCPGSGKLQGNYKESIAMSKAIEFHWSQSEYYLSGKLSIHWDLIKILLMIAKLHMTCDPITLFPRSAFIETPIIFK